MKRSFNFDLSSSTLHVLAMLFMLLDHTWATLLPGQVWMTCVGRLAFPIFAFFIAEGYYHTHDFGNYLKRMLLFALLSEIPFNLMASGLLRYPYHQNVLWTFLIALCGLRCMDKAREKLPKAAAVAVCAAVVLFTSLLSLVTMCDYFAAGVLTVYVFYFFRGRRWWCFVGQFLCLYYLNVEILGGLCYVIEVLGMELEIVQQGFALLSLPLLWLYRGRKGLSSRSFQMVCYGFYPVHCLVLAVLAALL